MAGYEKDGNGAIPDAEIDDHVWTLVARVLGAGANVNPADAVALREWIGGNDQRQALVDATIQNWHAAAAHPAHYDLVVAKQAVRERLLEPTRHALPFPDTRRFANRYFLAPWPVAIAAGILVAAVGVAGVGRWRAMHPIAPTTIQYATGVGERRTVTLIDGTQFALAPASRLTVPATYGRTTRDIALEGEAYFAVVHDSRHPFAVLTRNIRITDVGTEFDVRGYDGDVRVAVAKGNVVVGAGRGNGATGYPRPSMSSGTVSRPRPTPPSNTPPSFQDISLSAGDVAEFVNGSPVVVHHAPLAMYTGWLQGTLTFDDTPLRTVVAELARWYDVDVQIADSAIADRRLTATFGQRSADEVLEAVARVLGVGVERQGRHVIFRPGNVVRLPASDSLSPRSHQSLVQHPLGAAIQTTDTRMTRTGDAE